MQPINQKFKSLSGKLLLGKLIAQMTLAGSVALPNRAYAAEEKTVETVARTKADNQEIKFSFAKAIYTTKYHDVEYTVDVPYEETETYWDSEPVSRDEWVCSRGIMGAAKAKLAAAPKVEFKLAKPKAIAQSSGFGVGGGANDSPGPSSGGGGASGGGIFNPGGGGGGHTPTPPTDSSGGGVFNPGGGGGGGGGGGRGYNPPPYEPPQPVCHWETRTEWVQVQKTRTVTKYTQETRCCRSEPYDAFSHYWNQPVEVRFPAEAALNDGEQEKITFKLGGTEGNPKVTVDSSASIFRYKITRAVVSSGVLVVDLNFAPHITVKEAGAAAIGDVSLDFQAQGVEVRIQDKISNIRVQNVYQISIFEKGATTAIGQTSAVTREGTLVKAAIAGTFDAEKDYVVQIDVARAGIVLQGPVKFSVKKNVAAEKLDINKLKNKELVGKFSLAGLKETTTLRFVDQAPSYKTVKTLYAVRVSMTVNKKVEILFQGQVDRLTLTKDKDGRLLIPLKSALNAPDEQLAKLVKGKTIKVDLVTTRTSRRTGEINLKRAVDLTLTK